MVEEGCDRFGRRPLRCRESLRDGGRVDRLSPKTGPGRADLHLSSLLTHPQRRDGRIVYKNWPKEHPVKPQKVSTNTRVSMRTRHGDRWHGATALESLDERLPRRWVPGIRQVHQETPSWILQRDIQTHTRQRTDREQSQRKGGRSR